MNKFLLSFAVAFTTLSASAQTFGSSSWSKQYEPYTSQTEAVRSTPIAVASDGSSYVAGTYASDFEFGSFAIEGTKGAYIGKLNSSGQEQWAVALKGGAEVRSITTDGDGNLYAVGSFAETVTITDATETNTIALIGKANDTSLSSFFILKLNKDGQILAHKTIAPTPNATIAANTEQYFEEPGATFFRSTKVMWANNRIYFTAQYTGESTLEGTAFSADYFLVWGFVYTSVPKMSILSLDANTLSNVRNEFTIAYKDSQSEALTRPESINFTVINNTLYVASVATGTVTITTPNKSEDIAFNQEEGKQEHGFIFSEVSNVTFNTPYRSVASETEANFNFVNAMTSDANNIYVAGTFNQAAVFGVEKTFQGGSDLYVAAFSRNSNALRWVSTSNFNDGSTTTTAEALTGLVIANDKIFLTGYAENTRTRTSTAPLSYVLDTDGNLTKVEDTYIYGLAANHEKVVTGSVNSVNTVFTGYPITETTAVNALSLDNEIVRNEDVFLFQKPSNVVVVNANGNVVLSATNAQSISVSPLVKGLYILKANNSTIKFVK